MAGGIECGAHTDIGQRDVNEDRFVCASPCFVVADGMGGHAAGDVASGLAAEALQQLAGRGDLTVADVSAAIERANAAIVAASQADITLAGMGTTLCGLVSVTVGGEDHWMVFNVGDSRLYRLADGMLAQVTVDHSEAEEMVERGRISRRQARSYSRRHIVTRALGIEPVPTVDSWLFPPQQGERFVLCSDGLSGELDDEVIAAIANSLSDPAEAARGLVDAAIAAGGSDNVTVVVVDSALREAGVDETTVPRPPATSGAAGG
ncbi:protein phosphatase 2C domain-containing protein [Acidiferrimicrobium sp. IK]|uniref:PP2C family protein-serine/threonine phosphatase n=1 Tax=Acidiferrimicrobium sp. IK TaxID=2871700 RepID=UPI0021CB2E98|nr:protein phosphatase 2C domain-containing protein [Acidiferrimicrobium sp. IK]MCU4185610.1 protein phosphatase 2C domain-containing protein [Acidiferrimicrobium sp. IK]